jgi:4-hydroxythreonine-4-phosphate dehydrogenase
LSVETTNSSATAMVTVCEKRSQALRIVGEKCWRIIAARRVDNGAWLHAARPLALTMGDACGIGPEIIASWFRSAEAGGAFVVGDVAVMRRARRAHRRPAAGGADRSRRRRRGRCRRMHPVLQADGIAADLIDAPLGARRRARRRRRGALHRAGGRPRARRRGAALVTAPIHKEAFAAAGVGYPGHTEMLQALAAAGGARRRRCG